MASVQKSIPNLRWWIGGLLFASTVINYIDRQTLSLLAPYLKLQYHWTNSDYANLAIAFRVAYSIGQSVFGRLMDRTGTRRGLTITVIGYSVVSMLTSLARGFYSFATFRFLLGAGESANWPAATKAVSEWFPKRERALATALFDSGSSIGAAVAPFLVLWIYYRWGWRPAFAVPGILGFIWLIAWRWLYYPPESHRRISDSELSMIAADKREAESTEEGRIRPRWRDLLKIPQTWGTIIAKTFTDPVFFFITEWFPIYLVAKGIRIEERSHHHLDSLRCRRCGQLLCGMVFWIPCPARNLVGVGSQSADHLWRNRNDFAHSKHFHDESVRNRAAVRDRNVHLRRIHHHGQHVAFGSIPQ